MPGFKVRKTALIRNRYNQVPHLSQDTKWESNKITITVYSYDFIFNCTAVGQASDPMTTLTKSFNRWVGASCVFVAGLSMAQFEVFFSSDYL